MRVQCVATFKICAITFILGIILVLVSPSITRYLSLSTDKLIVLKKHSTGVVWDRRFQLPEKCQHCEYLEAISRGVCICWRAGSCFTANVESLYPAIDSLHKMILNTSVCRPTDQDILRTHWEPPVGVPDTSPLDNTVGGNAQAKQVLYSMGFFCSLDMRTHQSLLRGRWQVRS